jgi:nucleotide-binding universal stress UspA family protein
VFSVSATLWWMLHPPKTKADLAARKAERTLKQQLGTVIVVFSSEIQSEHMMVLAARLARGQSSELLAIYVIEVPFTLPTNAVMEEEDRSALDALASAEAIAKRSGVDVRTEVVHQRETAQAVLGIAKRERADLIIMGSYREGKYTGAPLGRDIERIAAEAKCDVLIGVEGKHGTLLVDEAAQASGTGETQENVSP